MSSTLPLYWNLSSPATKDRLDASAKLIASLERFQAQFQENSSKRTNEGDGEGADKLDLHNAQDVSYAIRRLVRGLASPRESSRLGFSVALTEVTAMTLSCLYASFLNSA